jgi:hypothetical protein
MATALHVQPPSRDELAADIRHHLPAMYLFHDCPEWLVMEIFGRSQYLPPYRVGLPLIPHPVLRDIDPVTKQDLGPLMVQANGRLGVRDTYGIKRDPRSNKPINVSLLEGQNAGDIVIFACENYGERGVVWLRGDESDVDRMDKSRKLYSRFVRGWAEGERTARSEMVGKFLALPANKGRMPPPPTPNQIRAQNILDSQDIRDRVSEFICRTAYDWEGDKFENYARHMKAAHGITVPPQRDETADAPGPGKRLSQAEIDALTQGAGDGNPNAEIPGAGMSMEGSAVPTIDHTNPKDLRAPKQQAAPPAPPKKGGRK